MVEVLNQLHASLCVSSLRLWQCIHIGYSFTQTSVDTMPQKHKEEAALIRSTWVNPSFAEVILVHSGLYNYQYRELNPCSCETPRRFATAWVHHFTSNCTHHCTKLQTEDIFLHY